MAPLPRELTVSDSSLASARTFVRSLNVLLKYSRLYGLEHTRSVEGFKSAWKELEAAVLAAGERGLLMGASGSQLLLDGVPLESTPAERKFADLLTDAGVASVSFSPHVSREDLLAFVRSFMESAIKTSTLAQRLEANLGGRSGIRLNEIRFVAEDAAYSDARVAAQLTVKTLGGDAGMVTDWLSSPEKMIQLIAAAEGSHGGPGGPEMGGPGIGLGPGLGTGGGQASGSGIGTGGGGPYPSGSGDTAAGSGAGTGGPYSAGSGGAAEGSGSETGGSHSTGSGGTAAGSGSGTGGSYSAGPGGAGSGGTAIGGAGAVGPGVGGTGTGGGIGGGVGSAVGAGAVPGGIGTGTGGVLGGSYVSGAPIANQAAISKLEEADLQSLLRLLVQFGEAQHAKTPQQNPDIWKQRMSALPPNAQITLRQALAGVAATSPSAKMDEATMLRLAEDLAIKFALDRFQRGEVRVNAVRQMLDRMGHELETLRKLAESARRKIGERGRESRIAC